MTSAAPLMEPAPAAPKSSLEIMLETIRKRDEQRQNDDDHLLPPSPARPRGRGRPPTTPRRRPLPAGWIKIGNGDGTVPVDKKPGAGMGGVTISGVDMILVDDDTESTCMRMRAEGGVTIVNEIVVDDAMSQDSEDRSMRAEGRGTVANPTPRPHGMVMLIQDDEDGTANHGATATDVVVDRAKQQDSESEIVVEDERSHTMITPGGGGATVDVCVVRPSASTTSSECRAPRPSVSPPRSSSGSSRKSSEPGKRTKAGVGKLLSGSTSCVRAPVAAVARMALKICGSGARALEQQTDQEAETSFHVHGATVKSPDLPSGGGGAAHTSTVKPLPASSMSRSGVVWRWLKKISGQLTDASGAEETKDGPRQRKCRSTPQP